MIMIFFLKYIFLPIFSLIFILKGWNYFSNWRYRGFKDFLLITFLDSIVMMFFIPLYLLRRKSFHRKIFKSMVDEAKKLNDIETSYFKFNMKYPEDNNKAYNYLHVVSYGLSDSKVFIQPNPNSVSYADAINSLDISIQNADYNEISKAYIKNVYEDLMFDGTATDWKLRYQITLGFQFSNIDEELRLSVYSIDYKDIGPSPFAIRLNYIKLLITSFVPIAKNFYFSIQRDKGAKYRIKRYDEFKKLHNLHQNDSIYAWLRELSDTPTNQQIIADWDNISQDILTRAHSSKMDFASFDDAVPLVNDSLNQLIDLDH